MEQIQLRRRSCMAKFAGGAQRPSRLVICEVGRTKLEPKALRRRAYCDYPDEARTSVAVLSRRESEQGADGTRQKPIF